MKDETQLVGARFKANKKRRCFTKYISGKA